MNTFDLIVFGVIVVSGLLAFMRGFVREVLAIGAWVGAVFAAIYFDEPTQPLFRDIIHAIWLADIVGPVVIFVLSLMALSLLTGTIASRVRNSGLGSVDRALGLAFGVARGIVVLCVCYILMNYVLPPAGRPAWIADAKTLPYLARGAVALEQAIPRNLVDRGATTLKEATQKEQAVEKIQEGLSTLNAPTSPPAAAPGADQGAKPKNTAPNYSASDQNGLNQLFKGAQ